MLEVFELLVFEPLTGLLQASFAILWPCRSAFLRRQQRICGILAASAILMFGLGLAVGWFGRSIGAFAIGGGVAYILAIAAGIVGEGIERRELRARRRAASRAGNKESSHVRRSRSDLGVSVQ